MRRRSQRWSDSASAGLIAVQVVGESSISAAPTLEIECPGGALIRLREDISAEVLQRVMQACQRVQANGGGESESVRSC